MGDVAKRAVGGGTTIAGGLVMALTFANERFGLGLSAEEIGWASGAAIAVFGIIKKAFRLAKEKGWI